MKNFLYDTLLAVIFLGGILTLAFTLFIAIAITRSLTLWGLLGLLLVPVEFGAWNIAIDWVDWVSDRNQ